MRLKSQIYFQKKNGSRKKNLKFFFEIFSFGNFVFWDFFYDRTLGSSQWHFRWKGVVNRHLWSNYTKYDFYFKFYFFFVLDFFFILFFCLIFDQEIKFLTTWLNYLFPFRQRTVSSKQWSVYNLKIEIFFSRFFLCFNFCFANDDIKWRWWFIYGIAILWPWVQNLGRKYYKLNFGPGPVHSGNRAPNTRRIVSRYVSDIDRRLYTFQAKLDILASISTKKKL